MHTTGKCHKGHTTEHQLNTPPHRSSLTTFRSEQEATLAWGEAVMGTAGVLECSPGAGGEKGASGPLSQNGYGLNSPKPAEGYAPSQIVRGTQNRNRTEASRLAVYSDPGARALVSCL